MKGRWRMSEMSCSIDLSNSRICCNKVQILVEILWRKLKKEGTLQYVAPPLVFF